VVVLVKEEPMTFHVKQTGTLDAEWHAAVAAARVDPSPCSFARVAVLANVRRVVALEEGQRHARRAMTPEQADGLACVVCAYDDGTEGMVPTGARGPSGAQLFAHARCLPPSDDENDNPESRLHRTLLDEDE